MQKKIKLEVAEAIAQKAFLAYLEKEFPTSRLPESLTSRMSMGAMREQSGWSFSLVLHEENPRDNTEGLRRDLEGPRPRELLTICVDDATLQSKITEYEKIPHGEG